MSATKRRICLLGSTGSIGQSTLDVARQHVDRYQIVALACGRSVDAFVQQIQEFRPDFVSVATAQVRDELAKSLLSESHKPREIFVGPEGHRDLVKASKPDVVMAAMLGSFGLLATLEAIRSQVGILGIANKEVLVMAGSVILEALKKSSTQLIPVDSEHSAIFQALRGNSLSEVRRVLLTASGGPFRRKSLEEMAKVTKEQALKHPNWVMGAKITIDSASMMNKGLEYIEAIRLFQLPPEKVEILVHPQSIIHSLVEYVDHSFMAQLGVSDMRVPISLAMSYPKRLPLALSKELDLVAISRLDFEAPDEERFPCLRLAREAEALGPEGSLILNAANEVAVDAFLQDEIGFLQIPRNIEKALSHFQGSAVDSLDAVIALDREVKAYTALACRLEGVTKSFEYRNMSA